MGQEEVGAGEVCRPGEGDQRGDVVLIVGEAADVTQGGVRVQAVGKALTAPVDDQRGKAARVQVGGGAAIFFKSLGPAGEEEDGAVGRIRAPEAARMRSPSAVRSQTARPPGGPSARSVRSGASVA